MNFMSSLERDELLTNNSPIVKYWQCSLYVSVAQGRYPYHSVD